MFTKPVCDDNKTSKQIKVNLNGRKELPIRKGDLNDIEKEKECLTKLKSRGVQ